MAAFFISSLSAIANPTRAEGNVTIVWSVRDKVPPQDLNGDGKLDRIVVSTSKGEVVTQIFNTIKVFNSAGKVLLKYVTTPAGGCAVGNILGNGRKQVAVWDYMFLEHEANESDHYYHVMVYDWDSHGKLSEAYYYQTERKYAFDFKVIGPWQEYLANQSKAIDVTNQAVIRPSASDLHKILKLGWNKKYSAIHWPRQVGKWIIVDRYDPNPRLTDYEALTEIWQREDRSWKKMKMPDPLKYYNGLDDISDVSRDLYLPASIYQKLKDNSRCR
jgi:hypothetical protein